MLQFAIALAMTPVAAVSAPSPAAAIETIGCVDAGLTRVVRTQLVADVERNIRNAGGDQTYAPEVIAGMTESSKACAAKNAWSEEARVASMLYTLPTVSWAKAVEIARGAGIDAGRLERRFMALPDAERIDGLREEVLSKVASAAVDAGEIKDSNALLAGAILGMLAIREKALSDFKTH